MHELSLVQSILDIVEDYQRRYKFQKVHSITLQYGELSGINQKSLEFAFVILSKDSVAKGSKLDFRKIPPKIRCEKCHGESVLEDNVMKCHKCGSAEVVLIGGMEELRLLEIDAD